MSYKLLLSIWMVMIFAATSGTLFGQHVSPASVSSVVGARKTAQPTFTKVNLFQKLNATSSQRGLDHQVSEATFLELDHVATQKFLQAAAGEIELSLPYQNGTIELELVEVDILSDDFTVVTSSSGGQPVDYTPGKFYRGTVKGNPHTVATLSVFSDEVMGMVSPNDEETLVLGRLQEPGNRSDYIFYSDKKLLDSPPFICGTETPDDIGSIIADFRRAEPGQRDLLMNCVRQYLEADYALYNNKGSVTATVNYLAGLFNEVATLYANESITTALSQVYVWVTPDSYSTSNSGTALSQFRTARSVFNGDLAMLTALGGNNIGGIAYVDGLCNASLRYGYANINSTYSTVPTFSWSVQVVAHEMGHNYGSPHTHACAWGPGNNQPIDCCGANAGYPEPGCTTCTLPDPAGGGTIMSYCHLSVVGINFNNGFGTEPGDLIRAKYNAASCLSACSTGGCVAPTNLSISNIQTNQATFSWSAVSGASSYNVQVKTNSGSTWNTFNTTFTIFTITGLTASQSYNFQVETVCPAGTSGYTAGMAFTTTVACPPAASNTLANQNPVCSGFNFTLSLSTSYSTGYTFQWQSSPNGSSYSNIAGATAATLSTTQGAATWYQCLITCSSQTTISTPLQVGLETIPANCYCVPATTTCSGFSPNPNLRINQVVLGSLNNSNNACSTNGYGNYLTGQLIPDLTIGSSSFITINFGDYQQRQTVFVDFNQDGDFSDAGESFNVPYFATYSQTGTITVPPGAATGQTRMRVRSRYWNDGVYPSSPCTGGFSGETEDYLVNIVSCTGTCYSKPQASVCDYGNGTYMRITRVQLSTLDNQNNSCGNTGGYQDFTTGQTVPLLTAGSSSTISVSIGTYAQRIAVFVDFNQNGSFNDAGETINIPYSPIITQSASIPVPADAVSGQTRMRIRSRNANDNVYPTAEDGGFYGETEDYMVNIQPLLPIELMAFNALANENETVTLQWETASERNTSFFTVQRSRDGRSFHDLENVAAGGNTISKRAYETIDPTPFSGTNYYRLKTVDLDGSEGYSPIVEVQVRADGFALLEMFPNPAIEIVNVWYRSAKDGAVRFTLVDITGKTVLSFEKASLKGENLAEMPLGALQAGIYTLTINDGTASYTKRLVKY
ncbi:MAG: fibronectin type III domain-containing protein [Lewinellaceae bacterium]|nr:fibronectin type III domain-containing protein [Saprospiraceae bacterium]MCB9341021.1 fibronectin type III domain-containing protein [Lewinellaceae bacterium]